MRANQVGHQGTKWLGKERVVVMGSTATGLEIAGAHPDAIVEVYERSWEAVDRGRELAQSRGLADRLVVRPRFAEMLTGSRVVRPRREAAA